MQTPKKSILSSTVTFFVNGEAVFEERLKYPENADGNGKVGLQAFIGTNPDIDIDQAVINKQQEYEESTASHSLVIVSRSLLRVSSALPSPPVKCRPSTRSTRTIASP